MATVMIFFKFLKYVTNRTKWRGNKKGPASQSKTKSIHSILTTIALRFMKSLKSGNGSSEKSFAEDRALPTQCVPTVYFARSFVLRRFLHLFVFCRLIALCRRNVCPPSLRVRVGKEPLCKCSAQFWVSYDAPFLRHNQNFMVRPPFTRTRAPALALANAQSPRHKAAL